jgi:GntR family transcriptional regulator
VYGVNVFSEDLMDGRHVEEADFTGSLNLWLESLGRGPVSSAASLQAVNLPTEVASLEGVDGKQPWILVTERCVDRQGVPVLFSEDYHRGDIFSFHVIRQRSN